jgi:hypothetical protein
LIDHGSNECVQHQETSLTEASKQSPAAMRVVRPERRAGANQHIDQKDEKTYSPVYNIQMRVRTRRIV